MLQKIKNKNRILTSTVAFILLISLCVPLLGAVTPAASANTQAEINRLRGEQRELDSRRRNAQARIESYEFEKLTYIVQKEVLDDRIMITQLEILNIKEVIALYEKLIIDKEIEVNQARMRENQQLEDYRARVRSMEENGVISYLEILFDSTSFSDLLARWDFINDIMSADERAFNSLTAARKETQAAEEALRETKAGLEGEKIELTQMEAELKEQVEEAGNLIKQVMNTIDGERELQAAITAESNSIQAEINRLVEQQRREEEERRRRAAAQRAAQQNSVVGTGQLIWPTSGPVTSPFGNRVHPVFGGVRFHGGIDIGAPHGARVVAADSGTVVISTFNSSFGNYIVINHGNGMTTLYAHLSTRLVGVGATVARGQHIGNVGSTGVSTGPHLHFEVSVNGTRVNPLRYL